MLLCASCDDAFDTHPYDVNYKGETHINARTVTAEHPPIAPEMLKSRPFSAPLN